jgi:hypothetical protein
MAEREAMRIGLAEELRSRVLKSTREGSQRDIAGALGGTEQSRQIFGAVLGKDAPAFISELGATSRAARNYNTVSRGSDTAENLNRMGSSIAKAIISPTRTATRVAGKGLDKLLGINQKDIAKILTDPKFAAKARSEAMKRDIKLARNAGKYHFNALRGAGPLTREGHPPARLSSKGWHELRKSPNPETYMKIPNVRDIYKTGEYFGPAENYHKRRDNIKKWHYFQKPINNENTEIQVGEDNNERIFYYIGDNPPKRRVAATPSQQGFGNSYNSISSFMPKVKPHVRYQYILDFCGF